MAKKKPPGTIRVGQRLVRWDGAKGYVDHNSKGTRIYGPGEPFQVVWLDADGSIEDAEYLTLEQLVVYPQPALRREA